MSQWESWMGCLHCQATSAYYACEECQSRKDAFTQGLPVGPPKQGRLEEDVMNLIEIGKYPAGEDFEGNLTWGKALVVLKDLNGRVFCLSSPSLVFSRIPTQEELLKFPEVEVLVRAGQVLRETKKKTDFLKKKIAMWRAYAAGEVTLTELRVVDGQASFDLPETQPKVAKVDKTLKSRFDRGGLDV